MKLGVVGLGYVGSVTAAVLASKGNSVIGVDIDRHRIESFASEKLPFYEPNLKETLKNAGKNIQFTTDYSYLKGCAAVFVCVATPSINGRISLKYVQDACESIKQNFPDTAIIMKSTVIPGTAGELSSLTGMKIISNPEFTREGTAIHDTLFPDRVVVGAREQEDFELARKIWNFIDSEFIETTNENAELIKYASNSFLATKISFINEFANLCEKIPNADVSTVAKGMGLDPRIGKDFLRAGIGYGGSCFPKDTEAIATYARDAGEKLSIVESAISANSERENRIADICTTSLGKGLRGAMICVLGLSFKEDTDDLRESKSLKLVSLLSNKGASVKVFDPVVKNLDITNRCDTINECLDGTDMAVVATEWPQFSEMLSGYNGIVVDARRTVKPESVKKYVGVGRHT